MTIVRNISVIEYTLNPLHTGLKRKQKKNHKNLLTPMWSII